MKNINYRAIKIEPDDITLRDYLSELNLYDDLKYFIMTSYDTWRTTVWECARGDSALYDRAKRYKEDKEWETDENVSLINALNALGEGEFVVRTICGCRQGDCAYLYINKESVDMTDYIEAVFYGRGVEVRVESLDDECPIYFYTEKWRDEDILEEAADRIGCSIDEIMLLDESDPRASERFTSDEYQDFKEAKAGVSTSDLVNLLKLLEEKGIEDDRMTFLKKVVADLKTDKVCPHCGETLYKSDLPQYRYVCPECEENFFDIEV